MKSPPKATVISKAPVQDRYEIQFAPELTALILKEGKVTTYRYGTKYDYLHIGDEVRLSEYDTRKLITRAIITKKEKVLFKDIPLHVKGHEAYKSKVEQKKVFSSYYTYLGRPLTNNDPFLLLAFKII